MKKVSLKVISYRLSLKVKNLHLGVDLQEVLRSGKNSKVQLKNKYQFFFNCEIGYHTIEIFAQELKYFNTYQHSICLYIESAGRGYDFLINICISSFLINR